MSSPEGTAPQTHGQPPVGAEPPAGPPERDVALAGWRVARVLVWLVYAFFLTAAILLVLTFFLLLFNANPTADFTQWVYRSADRVLEPFRGIFPSRELGDQGSVIDFAVLFAIIMYGIFAAVVSMLLAWLDRKTAEHKQALRQMASPGYGVRVDRDQ